LPRGTVTFLFTDIERSTISVAALGDERYADHQQTHRALLRSVFAQHGGVEVGTEGDAFFVVFERAADAVSAALDAQRAIEAQEWTSNVRLRIRAGLHTGEAVVRDGDYVGLDVHKAKRICDAGHGGQVLLSQTTKDLADERFLPQTVNVTDLGLHRLKDLDDRQRLFQIDSADLQHDFPPLRSLGKAQRNLPVQLTSFVGRERELAEIAAMLGTNRLVTLTGVGGCGKTRLAIKAASREADGDTDGVYFCDLTQISDDDELGPVVARSLGLERPESDIGSLAAREIIGNALSRQTALVVLDNCEHVIGAVAELAEDLLTTCPDLRLLATSREALEVPGEHTWSVPSLSNDEDAVQLFVERAASVRSDFTLSDDVNDIRSICERLDGIPLAIELAAAQIAHLAPRQIAERVDERFMKLTGGRRRVQRQQTLQAAMDWSWDLLTESDRTLLRRLAVFQNGCTLEAAESVCGDGIDVVEGLRSLVTKSLLIARDDRQGVRYRYLETVRLYAEDKLSASGESDGLRDRHARYYVSWLEAFPNHGRDTFYLHPTLSGLGQDAENIRAAIRWAEARGDWAIVVRLLTSSLILWQHHDQARTRSEDVARRALAADIDDVLRGRLLACMANYEASNGLAPAGAHGREAIELLGAEPSPWLAIAYSASAFARQAALLTENAEAAINAADRCLEVCRSLGPLWEPTGHGCRANVLIVLERDAEAAAAYIECFRPLLSDPQFPVHTGATFGLGFTRHLMGDRWPDEYERIYQAARDRTISIGEVVPSDALDHGAAGDYVVAHAAITEWLEHVRGTAPDDALRLAAIYAGVVACMAGRWARASRLFGVGTAGGIVLSNAVYAVYRRWLPVVREHLSADRGRALRDEGRSMPLEDALSYAQAWIEPAPPDEID
jgi:predicted ATPase/class 3 adenylate cyclase